MIECTIYLKITNIFHVKSCKKRGRIEIDSKGRIWEASDPEIDPFQDRKWNEKAIINKDYILQLRFRNKIFCVVEIIMPTVS